MNNIGWKIVSAGVGIAAGIVANKVVDGLWKAFTGRNAPDGDDINEPLIEAMVFAAVSAGVGAAFSQLAERKAAQWYNHGENISEAVHAEDA